MNLLPRPRDLSLGDELVPSRPPVADLDPSLPAQGYELRIGRDVVHLAARDDAGLFYGRATLDQLTLLHDGRLPIGTVRDWPDFGVRGVMLDIARDKVPTMDTLEALVDRLASWKINQVQLYIEHTFAYRGHEEVWAAASPLTPDEVVHLDDFCRARHVELVPNQNCLGHMGRWLAHERYRPMAIAPDGWPDARLPDTRSRAARPAAAVLHQRAGTGRSGRAVGARSGTDRRLREVGAHPPGHSRAGRSGDADLGRHPRQPPRHPLPAP